MSEFIEKKLRSAKVFLIYLIILCVVTIGNFVAMGFVDDIETLIGPAVLLTNALWISGVIYLVSYLPFKNSVKWLKNNGMENIADDIILDKPTLPRSKIYCGQNALFCKKPYVILPYSEIAWVYLYERRSYGIAVEKAVIIYTKEGKKYSLNANADEFKWLMQNYIVKNSPNLIVGYGAEQKARYKQLNPASAKKEKKAKKIWGIVLMCIGAELLITLIINIKNAEIVPAAIMILAAFGSGAALFITGNKKDDK